LRLPSTGKTDRLPAMINRWFHLPKLHVPAPGKERTVGWLELFYDLIFVATIIQLGTLLGREVSGAGAMRFAGVFTAIWYTWLGFTLYANRFVVDDMLHRTMTFAQMWAIGAVGVSVAQLADGNPMPFALSYGAARVISCAFYARSYIQDPSTRALTRPFMIGFAVGAALWLGSAALPKPTIYLVWGVALVIDFATPLRAQARASIARFPPDMHHLAERFGLLTLIVLGESFVKVLSSLSQQGGLGWGTLLNSGLSLAITCSLWWLYFDDVAGSRIKEGRLNPFIWIYGHLPLSIGVTATGVAIYKAVNFDPEQIAPLKYRLFLCGSLSLVLLSVALIDAVTTRRQSEVRDGLRTNMRLAAAALTMAMVPAGGLLPAGSFLGLVAAFGILQVLFDLSTAPHTDPHAAHAEHPAMFTPLDDSEEQGDEDGQDSQDSQPTMSDAQRMMLSGAGIVRRGAPNELRRDLYFHFMQGSWTQIFLAIVLAYLGANLVFAMLFMMEPGSVSSIRSDSFIDAFSFSVQTMSTIGYGTMAPVTTYAHMLVTAEAFVGVVGVALVTGLIFAKASRPQSSVLFSKCAIVDSHDGKRVLSFRVANARGNEVVEATLRVAILRNHVSAEGQQLRKLADLKLERDMTPVFMMSWQVFHILDESSPLHDVDAQTLHDEDAMIIVTLTGHDGTYAQTTHARHAYGPRDIRIGHHFRDVMSRLEDGRIVLDLERFHDTIAHEDAEQAEEQG